MHHRRQVQKRLRKLPPACSSDSNSNSVFLILFLFKNQGSQGRFDEEEERGIGVTKLSKQPKKLEQIVARGVIQTKGHKRNRRGRGIKIVKVDGFIFLIPYSFHFIQSHFISVPILFQRDVRNLGKSLGANTTQARTHAEELETSASAHATGSQHKVSVINYNVIILFFAKLRGCIFVLYSLSFLFYLF